MVICRAFENFFCPKVGHLFLQIRPAGGWGSAKLNYIFKFLKYVNLLLLISKFPDIAYLTLEAYTFQANPSPTLTPRSAKICNVTSLCAPRIRPAGGWGSAKLNYIFKFLKYVNILLLISKFPDIAYLTLEAYTFQANPSPTLTPRCAKICNVTSLGAPRMVESSLDRFAGQNRWCNY